MQYTKAGYNAIFNSSQVLQLRFSILYALQMKGKTSKLNSLS